MGPQKFITIRGMSDSKKIENDYQHGDILKTYSNLEQQIRNDPQVLRG